MMRRGNHNVKTIAMASLLLLCVIAGLAFPCNAGRAFSVAIGKESGAAPLLIQHRVVGVVIDKISGIAYSGFTIKVFDSDAPQTVLGTGRTDNGGRYEIRLNRSRPTAISIDVFNGSAQRVKSATRLHLNDRGPTQVDFFLFRAEAIPNIFCCASSDHFGGCPASLLFTKRLKRLLDQLKAYSSNWRLRLKVVEELLRQSDPADDCGESQKTQLIVLLKSLGEFGLLDKLTETCLDEFPAKHFKTPRFKISYVDDQDFEPVAVNPERPAVDEELKLPDHTSLGWLRANLDVPTYVQQIGLIAEYSLSRLLSPRLMLKDPRGDPPVGLIPISICFIEPFAGLTSPSQSDIEIHSKNSLVQNFGTVPHELFHRVQYQYNATEEVTGLYGVMREGGARLIEDSSCDIFNRYALQSQQIFRNPAQSLIHFDSRCDNPISYASGLFWKYLAEQHSLNVLPADEPDIGFDVYRRVLEVTADPNPNGRPYTSTALRRAISTTARPGNFDEFRYVDTRQNELSSNETSWGNYLLANYLHSLPGSDARFQYIEDNDEIMWPDDGSGLDLIRKLEDLKVQTDNILTGQDNAISRTVIGQPAYAARYYRITPNALTPPRMLRVSLSAFGGMTDTLIQILRFGPDGVLTDISKSDQPSYTKTINMNGVSSVVVIIASRMNAGDYTVTFDEVPGGSDVMITRWNSALLTEYELNPRDWTRTSPDLVDSDNDGVPDAAVVPGTNNKLKVRIHNRGNMGISGVHIDLHYQPAIPQLRTDLWLPIRNAANVTQSITNISLTPGQSNWSVVDWAPTTASTSGWCVKATVHAPGDLNTDNKIAIGCFNRSP